MMKQVFNVANGDRPDAPDTAIVITDGRSTYDSNLTIPYAEEAKRRGIEIFGKFVIKAHRPRCLYTDEYQTSASPPIWGTGACAPSTSNCLFFDHFRAAQTLSV